MARDIPPHAYEPGLLGKLLDQTSVYGHAVEQESLPVMVHSKAWQKCMEPRCPWEYSVPRRVERRSQARIAALVAELAGPTLLGSTIQRTGCMIAIDNSGLD